MMIKNAIIYKHDIDEIAVVVLAGKIYMCVMYGNDYCIQGLRFGNITMYSITLKLNGGVVGCVLVEEYINELWKGVPSL